MTTNAVSVDRERRWTAEAAFFDAEAEQRLASLEPIDARVVDRYSGRLRRHNLEEFRYSLLGNLEGRRVLDIGCGEGVNSVLLAKLGGIVTGIDISPKAIQLSEQRARVNGVADRCRFLCSPLETADLPPESFDVIWGDAILHHLIPELSTLLPRIAAIARLGGLIVFAEPINLDPWLRRLRLMLPLGTAATPDERPLEAEELGILRRQLPDLHVVPFRLLGRVDRFVLPDYQYERAPMWRRRTLDALAVADHVLFSVPALRHSASMAVLWARRS
jgi:2-polyprenyl-3-methyl-5-hydroxy-6-metoxy-1,4-benzoquinol methylase